MQKDAEKPSTGITKVLLQPLIAVACMTALLIITVNADKPDHLSQALLLINQLQRAQQLSPYNEKGLPINRYGGRWGSSSNPAELRFASSGQHAEVNAQCSSFVTLLLQEVYQWQPQKHTFYDYYVILPSTPLWDIEKFIATSDSQPGKRCQQGFSYNSGNNEEFLTVDDIRYLMQEKM